MHTFEQKPKATQQTKSVNSAPHGRAFRGQDHTVATMYLRRTTGNQATQRLLQANSEEFEAGSAITASTRFVHDFSQIPLHSKAHASLQPKLKVNGSGDLHAQEVDHIAEPAAFAKSGPVLAVQNSKQKSTPDLHQCRDNRDNKTENRTGMSDELKAGLESLSGMDLSDVRVHRNSPIPAWLNALAYTQGQTIRLAPGQDKHLPHEGCHVIQQLQGRVKPEGLQINNDARLEAEADRMSSLVANRAITAQQPHRTPGKIGLGDSSRQPVQRKVRINGGRSRVNEIDYVPFIGSRRGIGTRYSVASLIADNVRRVFTNVAELEGYANGQTDFIGDVVTSSAGTFWYRLPENHLTVLGERHHNPSGNVEDVILGLQTSRFMYEPFHEFTSVSPIDSSQIGGGTQARLAQIGSGRRVASLIDPTNFDPGLENIVIKALTGASVTRNEFIAGNPVTMNATDRQTWSGRSTTNDYSYGERIALYLSMAIHIAADIAQFSFGSEIMIESNYFNSARRLSEFYQANQAVLDAFMTAKDNDDLIGVYELTAPNGFAHLSVLNDFTLVFHEYASRYIEQLGVQTGSATLEAEGQALSGNQAATLTTLSPTREEVMWERIQHANSSSYLIVGMGDAHRQNLQPRLDAAGIRHEEVAQALVAQQATIAGNWVP
jgi:hypothetical protein